MPLYAAADVPAHAVVTAEGIAAGKQQEMFGVASVLRRLNIHQGLPF
jgi:hypothetical protein